MLSYRITVVFLVLIFLAACGKNGEEKREQNVEAEPNYYFLALIEAQVIAESEGISEIDAIREYIRRNATHGYPIEPYEYDSAIRDIYLHSKGLSEKPVALCGNFANLMARLLAEAGIPFQMVNAFSSYFTNCLQGHAYLQAYNEESEEYEIHDPDYNIFYRFKESGLRASAEDLAYSESIDLEIEPCRGKVCGWDLAIPEDLAAIFGVDSVRETLLNGEYYSAIENATSGFLYIPRSRYPLFDYFLCSGEGPMSFEDAVTFIARGSIIVYVD